MKKLIALLSTLILATMLAACSAGRDGNVQSDKNATVGISNGIDGGDCLYGKITSIVGNEIELAIAEMPEDETLIAGEGDEGDDNAANIPDGPVAAAPATLVEQNSDSGENMNFTGETLTITLPAGVKIWDMGQETTMSALKKGSVVYLVVDNLDDMNVMVVDIMR